MGAHPDSPGGSGVMGRPVKVEEEMRVPVSQDTVSYESISSFEDRGRGHGQWVLGSLGTRKKKQNWILLSSPRRDVAVPTPGFWLATVSVRPLSSNPVG